MIGMVAGLAATVAIGVAAVATGKRYRLAVAEW
jgi:hypothetical protein